MAALTNQSPGHFGQIVPPTGHTPRTVFFKTVLPPLAIVTVGRGPGPSTETLCVSFQCDSKRTLKVLPLTTHSTRSGLALRNTDRLSSSKKVYVCLQSITVPRFVEFGAR